MTEQMPTYRFSDCELKALVSYFRQHAPLPDALYALNAFAEKYIYNNLTVDEAEALYTDRQQFL